ncbi:STAS/SEC14 domain-containing protein [Luteolibacter marinus]|uniref:STAS/SEC14 domain-containing protein n=1 Tax=Luteolibacter marinus TaxID=2776705 RepID=UPI001867A2A9|nr:STAS/SEC14 domain-containing protein [Luteolibacter marinus]
MIKELPSQSTSAIGFELSGRLHDDDYTQFVPQVDAAIARGSDRLLAWFHNFEGWDLHALWDDAMFGVQHATSLKRIALVGEKKWEGWMAKACKPFTKADVRYFDAAEIDAAWRWLDEPGDSVN